MGIFLVSPYIAHLLCQVVAGVGVFAVDGGSGSRHMENALGCFAAGDDDVGCTSGESNDNI